MITNEQILMRIGVDAKAVQTGLDRAGALIKGWATSVSHHLKGAIGGFFAVAAAERFFDRLKERVLEIKNLSAETGFSTDFIQGAQQRLSEMGKDPNTLARPLIALSAEAGMRGMTGIQLLKNLATSYEKLNTQEEKNAFIKSQQIKGWQELLPLIEGGEKAVDRLGESSFFTKMSSTSINNFSDIIAGSKTLTNIGQASIMRSTLGDFAPLNIVARISQGLGMISAGTLPTLEKFRKYDQSRTEEAQKKAMIDIMQNAADKDHVSLAEKQLQILNEEKTEMNIF
jgi:hypothetical protein